MAKCCYLGVLRKVQREKVKTCCSYFLEDKEEEGGRWVISGWGGCLVALPKGMIAYILEANPTR